MLGDREVTSEQLSSLHEGVGYDEVYLLECEPNESLSWSPEREPSAYSPTEGEKKEYEEDEEGECDKGDEGEDEEEEEKSDKGSQKESDRLVGQVESSGTRPFILPKIWTVNDFYSTMSQKVFNTLRDHHQIPDNIPLRLLGKFEKCYSRKTMDINIYDVMFSAGLRLPLTELHRQLANYLGLSISQIAPNACRIFIGAKVIWS